VPRAGQRKTPFTIVFLYSYIFPNQQGKAPKQLQLPQNKLSTVPRGFAAVEFSTAKHALYSTSWLAFAVFAYVKLWVSRP